MVLLGSRQKWRTPHIVSSLIYKLWLNVRLKGHRDQVSVHSVVRSAAGSSSTVREGSRTRGKQSVRPAVDDGTDRILFPSPGSMGAGFR